MSNSIHYVNGRETALVKLGFMGFEPTELKHIGVRAAGGALGGAAVGAASAGEGNRGSGALTGGLVGGIGAGAMSAGHKKLFKSVPGSDESVSIWNELSPATREQYQSMVPHIDPSDPGAIMRAVDLSDMQKGVQGFGAARTATGGALAGGLAARPVTSREQPEKLGYYDRNYDPYDGLSDSIYRSSHAMRDQQRLEMEDRDHRARAFAGRVSRNPGELEALQAKLTQNEIDESRAAHGAVGGFLGGSLGAMGGAALGGAIKPHGILPALGMVGGAALGGYGGYKFMEPMGQEAGQQSADEIIDLAHTHGLQNLQRPPAAPTGPAAKLAFLGFNPAQMKHIGLRAAGGAAAGAGVGAVAGGENNYMSGALAGGAMGGLAAGGASMAHKGGVNRISKALDEHLSTARSSGRPLNLPDNNAMRIIQHARNAPSRVAEGITSGGIGRTMLGGAAMGAVPAMAAGRMMRDET